MVSHDQLQARVGELLDAESGLTLARLQDELGVAHSTETRVLPRCAGERIADLCAAEEDLSFEEATERLGYTAAVRKAAITYARTALRGRRLRLYVRSVVDALVAEGLASQQGVVIVPVADDVLAAAVVLAFDAPASALVWDERWGWRTPRAAAPDGSGDRGSPPEDNGVRYLGPDQQPAPEALVAAVYDDRCGTRRRPAPKGGGVK